MMTYIVLVLSTLFVISFVAVSSKPSPIYGGLGLIVGGGMGCGVIMGFGGSFLGLMVFLIYLGGMLVVFGYTTAMCMEQYPEVLVSNKVLLGGFVVGVLMEFMMVLGLLSQLEMEYIFKFNGLGDWVVCGVGESGFVSEETTGVAGLYSYGIWLVVITGWTLVIAVVVIMEVTRGN